MRNSNVPTQGRLTYYQDKSLKLDLQYKSEDTWETCFEVTEPVKIPSVAYLGFSAETGELNDNFDVIEVQTKNLYTTQPANPGNKNKPGPTRKKSQENRNRGGDSEGGSWTWFFVKVVLFILVAGGGYVGYTVYRTQKRGSRFD